MLRKSAIFGVIAIAAGGVAYLQAGVQPLVCRTAMDVASLPPDLQYTGGFTEGRAQTVFTRYEMGLKGALLPESQTYLSRINTALQAKGTQLVFLLVPPRAVVLGSFAKFDAAALDANYRTRLAQLRSTGMMVPDALSSLQAQSSPLDVFYARDTHWTPAGARVVAQAVADEIKNLPAYKQLPPQAFTTRAVGQNVHKGNYAFQLLEACDTAIIPEALTRYETTNTAGQVSLLDDAMPPVTLVGTSFSNRTGIDLFNFAGALRQALQQDVLNQAVDGGGYDAAILNYVDSDAFRQSPPKALVWEIISEMEQNHPHIYRQLLPAIVGTCAPLYEQAANLSNGGVLLDIAANTRTAGARQYLAITIADRAVLVFGLTLEYADGQKEVVRFNRSNRVPNNGRFFLELSDSYTAPLVRVSMDAGSGSVTSSLCEY